MLNWTKNGDLKLIQEEIGQEGGIGSLSPVQLPGKDWKAKKNEYEQG